jgi:methionyl-tRNA formyltransferase
MNDPTFAFFGGEPLAAPTLDALETAGLLPTLVVTNPDRPVGRKQILTPPPAKAWAHERGIDVFQPESLKDRAALGPLLDRTWDLFVVVAYNHILPTWLIAQPQHGTLNVHPSLLPLLRGPSPIRTAILEDTRETGVTIMRMDEKMDHGPIVAQELAEIDEQEWPLAGPELDRRLAELGGQLLAETIPAWVAGDIEPQDQAHEYATYTKKFTREDGELNLDPYHLPTGRAAYDALLKIRAFTGFPETYFEHAGIRIKIKEAELAADGSLRLSRITPAGKQEMAFTNYFDSN